MSAVFFSPNVPRSWPWSHSTYWGVDGTAKEQYPLFGGDPIERVPSEVTSIIPVARWSLEMSCSVTSIFGNPVQWSKTISETIDSGTGKKQSGENSAVETVGTAFSSAEEAMLSGGLIDSDDPFFINLLASPIAARFTGQEEVGDYNFIYDWRFNIAGAATLARSEPEEEYGWTLLFGVFQQVRVIETISGGSSEILEEANTAVTYAGNTYGEFNEEFEFNCALIAGEKFSE